MDRPPQHRAPRGHGLRQPQQPLLRLLQRYRPHRQHHAAEPGHQRHPPPGVDRFAQHCHVVDIDADSWRDKERLERNGRPPRKPKR